MTIPILEELARAYEDYPHVYLELDIDVLPESYSRDEIWVLDQVEFRIKARNTGPLDMNQLRLKVTGLNGTLVRSNGAHAEWGESFEISGEYFGDLPGHQPGAVWRPNAAGRNFRFYPRWSASDDTPLVKVEVIGWETDDSHLSKGHTRADSAAYATFDASVTAIT